MEREADSTSHNGCCSDGRARLAASPSTTAPGRDLAYASALLRVIDNMHDQPNVGTLLSAVAEYGATPIPAMGSRSSEGPPGDWGR
jgi:hypothetical protein